MFYKMIIHISSVIAVIIAVIIRFHCNNGDTYMYTLYLSDYKHDILTQLLNLSLTTEAAQLIGPGAKPKNYNKIIILNIHYLR